MAYTDFTLSDLHQKFGIENRKGALFPKVKPVPASRKLKTDLGYNLELPQRSEKAKSELIVLPILLDVRLRNDRFFTIYSGEILAADPEAGLNGECDFIVAKDTQSFEINYPIFQIVEAKKNDIDLGVPQCAAQMVGARVFNQKKGLTVDTVFGCVTTGDDWNFMRLAGNTITVDERRYYLGNLPELLGVFQKIIGFFKGS
jgi:hypothetical protein